jgi:phospholipid/cholesterol/gamma-HCH transport system substrate-binding protein
MRSRTFREGSVGLLILLGMGLFGGLILWLRGFNPGSRAYNLEIELQDASGIEVGSTVRYRGVKVGTITGMRTDTDYVNVTAMITTANLVIPRQSMIETTQSGVIGRAFLDIRPPSTQLISQSNNLSPFQPNCDSTLILCNGDKIKGKIGANFNALIRSTTEIAQILNQSQLINNASTTLTTANTTMSRVDRTAVDLATTARSLNTLTLDAKGQLNGISTASTAVTNAANQVTGLVQTNRGSISATLKNLDGAGQELRVAMNDLKPFMSRLNNSKALTNLELLADNGAAITTNLKSLSGTLNNPVILLGLAQTLDSARATFVNTQKITNELQQVTGDEKFRKSLQNLIRGLNRLMSSSQELEQHLLAVQGQPNSPLVLSPQSINPQTQWSTAPLLLTQQPGEFRPFLGGTFSGGLLTGERLVIGTPILPDMFPSPSPSPNSSLSDSLPVQP